MNHRFGRSHAAKEVDKIVRESKQLREHRAAVQQARQQNLDRIVAHQLEGLPEFESEYEFHPVRKWRLDYAWPEYKVALEVHGGVFTKGRHTTGTGFTKDCEKFGTAGSMGWIIIPVTTDQLKQGVAREFVAGALNERGA